MLQLQHRAKKNFKRGLIIQKDIGKNYKMPYQNA